MTIIWRHAALTSARRFMADQAGMRQVNRAIILAAGHGGEDDGYDWGPLARTGEPIVLYMVMHNLERISQALIGAGRHPNTPAAAISAATGRMRPRSGKWSQPVMARPSGFATG